jgi:NitT/TauT family transport system ATP-binding protein
LDQAKGDQNVLVIEHLQKTYGSSPVAALADLNLEVRSGELVSLLGPSGCGKTTALRIVGGLLEPSSGSVLVEGRPSPGPSREKAMVFQLFNLFPWRTAEANVAFGLEAQGMKKRDRLGIARDYLRLVGLADKAESYPSQLSGGQNQRLGLARALAIEPKILLMDEPFGALDALTREHLQAMLQEICTDRNLTTLFVTHSIDEAIFLSDRIVLMTTPGRVIADYEVKLARPRTVYDWRATPQYSELRAQIWGQLQAEQTAPAGSA